MFEEIIKCLIEFKNEWQRLFFIQYHYNFGLQDIDYWARGNDIVYKFLDKDSNEL